MSKTTRTKWAGDMAQVVEYLLCKGEVLSSGPSSTKKKKKERKEGLKIRGVV
jgi:hypothetical protein